MIAYINLKSACFLKQIQINNKSFIHYITSLLHSRECLKKRRMVNFHHTSYGQHLYEVPNFEKSSISETIQLLVENAQLKILNIYLSIQTRRPRKPRVQLSSTHH